MLLAAYASVGAGLLMLFNIIVGVLCTVVVLEWMESSRTRRRQLKYWLALTLSLQPIPVALWLRQSVLLWKFAEIILLTSLLLIPAGILAILVWPKGDPGNNGGESES